VFDAIVPRLEGDIDLECERVPVTRLWFGLIGDPAARAEVVPKTLVTSSPCSGTFLLKDVWSATMLHSNSMQVSDE